MADHRKSLLLVIAVFALAACAPVYKTPYGLAHGPGTWERAQSCPADGEPCACYRARSPKPCPGGTPCPDTLFRTDIDNDACSKDALQLERAYYPSLVKGTAYGQGDAALPLLGVTLSGGGARSASTSIGFLSGLDHKGILAQVDLISSVSGGSYASYWFYSHLYNAEKANKPNEPNERGVLRDATRIEDRYAELFRDDRRFQLQVSQNSRLASKSQGPVTSRLEMAGELLSWLPMIPLHWLTAGLFDRKDNLNPLTHYYHAGLERAYGLYPEGNPPPVFRNESGLRLLDTELAFIPRFEANDPSFEEIQAVHRAQGQAPVSIPPFWIINATAVYGGKAKMFREASWGGFSHDLRDTIYEFTPLHYGSPRLGYCDYKLDPSAGEAYRGCKAVDPSYLKYGRIVGASGAAVDGVNPTVNVLLDVLNAAIGRYVDNPRVDDSVRLTHQWLPFPLYGFHRSIHDEAAPRIYLTDGGHAENLGLYALIKRKVKNIVVLDAEQEHRSSDGHFEAGFAALQELRCRLYAEHGLHLMIKKDGTDLFDYKRKTEGDRSSDPTPCNTTFARSEMQFPVQGRAFPYLQGWICLSGTPTCDDDPNRLNIFYVKLAIDQETAKFGSEDPGTWDAQCLPGDRYRCGVRKYFHKYQKIFPHDGTQDIFYSEEQYKAYRDLGFDLAKCIKFAGGKLARDPTYPGCGDSRP